MDEKLSVVLIGIFKFQNLGLRIMHPIVESIEGCEVVDNATTGQKGVIQKWDLTTTSYTPATGLAAGTYHVFVMAVDSNGNQSGWSVEMDFTVVA